VAHTERNGYRLKGYRLGNGSVSVGYRVSPNGAAVQRQRAAFAATGGADLGKWGSAVPGLECAPGSDTIYSGALADPAGTARLHALHAGRLLHIPLLRFDNGKWHGHLDLQHLQVAEDTIQYVCA